MRNLRWAYVALLQPDLFKSVEAFDLARHGRNYKQAFCDGHVTGISPRVLFNPTDTAPMWNYDHDPHPELWTP
jgi:prepilin-type processing-associated H-X9-DG protein